MDFTFYLRYGQQTLSCIEARRPIVRLRQRSRRPWNIETAWPPSYRGSLSTCSTPTAIPSVRGRPDNGGRSHHERSFPELRESVEKRRLEYLQTRRENIFSLRSSYLRNYSG
jgi:hypothetical protein